jgi:hypothetical protein
MPIPIAPGYTDYSSDGTNKYTPIIFSGKTLQKFYETTFLSRISVTDYLGEIRNKGDKVTVRTVPDITIRDYQKGSSLILEHPESPSIEFTINRAKYFNFALDDIDIHFMDLNMIDKYADDASQQLKLTVEREALGWLYTQVNSKNQGANAGQLSGDINLGTTGVPLSVTKSTILDVLIDCGIVLDEQTGSTENRWILLPPAIAGMIKKSDLRDASITGDPKSVLRTGLIGRIDRFDIYVSNLLTYDSGDSAWHCLFGCQGTIMFVSALSKTEVYRPQNTFANAMKGLMVYDFDVLYDQFIGHLYITKG